MRQAHQAPLLQAPSTATSISLGLLSSVLGTVSVSTPSLVAALMPAARGGWMGERDGWRRRMEDEGGLSSPACPSQERAPLKRPCCRRAPPGQQRSLARSPSRSAFSGRRKRRTKEPKERSTRRLPSASLPSLLSTRRSPLMVSTRSGETCGRRCGECTADETVGRGAAGARCRRCSRLCRMRPSCCCLPPSPPF